MSANTSIEWTDASWNPLRGIVGRHHCVRISPGCKNCYAATMNRRFKGPDYVVGADTPRLDANALEEPLHWRAPRKVFVCSMTDLFLDAHTDEMIAWVFAVMAFHQRHTFQVLTKRADRMRSLMTMLGEAQDDVFAMARSLDANEPPFDDPPNWPLPNVWLGVSCENQQYADERIPLLLQTPGAVRWVSAEPLLGPTDFTRILVCDDAVNAYGPLRVTHDALTGWEHHWPKDRVSDLQRSQQATGRRLDWVVVGGESGPGARPCDLAWIRSIVQQCKRAAVPAFVKQLGAKPVTDGDAAHPGKFRLDQANRKGGDISEWPEDLRVREWPRVEVPA